MKKRTLIILGVIVLFLLSGCFSKVPNHAKEIESLFVAVKETRETSESTTTDSSSTTNKKTRTTTSSTSTNKNGKTRTSTQVIDEQQTAQQEKIDRMREMLIEEGVFNKESNMEEDLMIEPIFISSGLVYIDQELWSICMDRKDFKDLKKQLKPQYDKQKKADKDRTRYTYVVDLWLPDIGAIKSSKLSPKLDKLDYEKLNYDPQYLQNYTSAIHIEYNKTLRAYLKSEKELKMAKVQLTLSVTEKDKNKYEAKLENKEMAKVRSAIQKGEETANNEVSNLKEMKQVTLIQTLNQDFLSHLPVILKPRIKTISKEKDNTYQVTLQLADNLNEILPKVRDLENEAYKASYPKGSFTQIADGVIRQKMFKTLESQSISYKNEKNISFHYTQDKFTYESADKELIENEITPLVNKTADEIKTFLDANVLKKKQPRPETGVISGNNSGNPIAITIPSGNNDYFIKFRQISGTDLNEEGTQVLAVYIRSGEPLTINLPAGNYKFLFGRDSGDNWYGEADAFGPDKRYSQGANVMAVQQNYNYELKLHGVANGNMPITGIDGGKF